MTEPEFELLADIVRDFVAEKVAAACSPLVAEIRELKDQLRELSAPVAGQAVDPEFIRMAIAGEVTRQMAELPRPKDGIDGAPGRDGVNGFDGRDGAVGRDGIDGKDAEPVDMNRLIMDCRSIITETVQVEVRNITPVPGPAGPSGKDGAPGQSVDVNDMVSRVLERLSVPKTEQIIAEIQEQVTKAVAAIPAPQPGRDGEPGRPGKDAEPIHPDTVARLVTEAVEKRVAAIPVAKDGAPGRDALQIDILPAIDPTKTYPRATYARHCGGIVRAFRDTDKIPEGGVIAASGWEVVVDGVFGVAVKQGENLRSFSVRSVLVSGHESVQEFTMPVMIQRGVHIGGNAYERGDVVTLDGSQWHCEVDRTKERPGASKDWILIVKHGRNGKDAGSEIGLLPQKPVRLK